MAFAFLTAHALHLKRSGISYVLMPEDCPKSPAAAHAIRQQTAAAAPAARQGAPAPRTWQRPTREQPAYRKPAETFRHQPQTEAGRSQGNRVPPAAPPRQRSGQEQPGTAIRPPAAWTADWQTLLARTRPGIVGWTYYGLGHDLCGTPNTQRRSRLTELIGYLGMPAGTHTFWPVGLPGMDEDGNLILKPCEDCFWHGLRRLQSRVLIVMGSPAARAIGIRERIQPMNPLRAYNGVRLLITWDIDLLDDETRMISTKTYLSRMLNTLL